MQWGWHVVEGEEVVAECVCDSLRDWLEFLVKLGGTYEVCDDPRRMMFGMRKIDGGTRVMVRIARLGSSEKWNLTVPREFKDLLRTSQGRDKLAWVLSVGDHCLEF